MTKQEAKKYLLVKVKSKVHKVYVEDLKAIFMRKKLIAKPRVPAFDEKPLNSLKVELETDLSVCS